MDNQYMKLEVIVKHGLHLYSHIRSLSFNLTYENPQDEMIMYSVF